MIANQFKIDQYYNSADKYLILILKIIQSLIDFKLVLNH